MIVQMIPYIAIAYAAGLVIGMLFVYFWVKSRCEGTLKIIDRDGYNSVFLVLENDLASDVKRKKIISLRVECSSYNEN